MTPSDKDLEARARTIMAEVAKEEGLSSLSFSYEGIDFLLSAKAIYDPRTSTSFYSIPVQISFPNGNAIDKFLIYDADKEVFIYQLIEIHEMQKYYPDGVKDFESGKTDSSSKYAKWDSNRMDISHIFSILFNSQKIPLEEADVPDYYTSINPNTGEEIRTPTPKIRRY